MRLPSTIYDPIEEVIMEKFFSSGLLSMGNHDRHSFSTSMMGPFDAGLYTLERYNCN